MKVLNLNPGVGIRASITTSLARGKSLSALNFHLPVRAAVQRCSSTTVATAMASRDYNVRAFTYIYLPVALWQLVALHSYLV